jgi:site-specific DNA recombinase
MTIIAGYVRVSTAEQAKGENINSQIASVETFVSNRSDKIDEMFADNGISGSLLARPELDRLRDKILGGEVEKLYVYSVDRLSRKQANLYILLEEFKKAHVQVIFTSTPNFFDGGEESEIINTSIFGLVSELERIRIKIVWGKF